MKNFFRHQKHHHHKNSKLWSSCLISHLFCEHLTYYSGKNKLLVQLHLTHLMKIGTYIIWSFYFSYSQRARWSIRPVAFWPLWTNWTAQQATSPINYLLVDCFKLFHSKAFTSLFAFDKKKKKYILLSVGIYFYLENIIIKKYWYYI